MIGEDLCPSEEEVRDIEIGWKEGTFPSPRVSSSPPPSARCSTSCPQLQLLLDLLCLHERCSRHVCCTKQALVILTGQVLECLQGVWQSRRLFWADLGQEQEVLDRRCTMVAPGRRLSEEVEGRFWLWELVHAGQRDQEWFVLGA